MCFCSVFEVVGSQSSHLPKVLELETPSGKSLVHGTPHALSMHCFFLDMHTCLYSFFSLENLKKSRAAYVTSCMVPDGTDITTCASKVIFSGRDHGRRS